MSTSAVPQPAPWFPPAPGQAEPESAPQATAEQPSRPAFSRPPAEDATMLKRGADYLRRAKPGTLRMLSRRAAAPGPETDGEKKAFIAGFERGYDAASLVLRQGVAKFTSLDAKLKNAAAGR